MVIKKSELEGIIATERQQEIAALIQQVDSVLKTSWTPGEQVTVTVRSAYGVVVKHVMKLYEEAGWKVTANSDQRDGDWITLK